MPTSVGYHNYNVEFLQTLVMLEHLASFLEYLQENIFEPLGMIDTSFNLRGEPMVCSPNDAIKTFHNSGLDELYLGDYLIHK